MTQVLRGFGEYECAAELLEEVAEEFPQDRVVRLALGNLYYLLEQYDRGVTHLLTVLDEIDPEEIGAHYNLMLIYRAMGETDKVTVHEARYRRYKEDEDIRQLTGAFKRADAAANNEAQQVHRHSLTAPGDRFSAADRFPPSEFLEGGRYAKPPTEFPGPMAPWRRRAVDGSYR